MYNTKCYTGKTKTLKTNKKERIKVSVLPTLSHQLAYELLPTNSLEILELDKVLSDVY